MNDQPSLLQPLQQLLSEADALMQLALEEDWEGLQPQAENFQQHMHLLEDQAYLARLRDAGLATQAQDVLLQIQLLNDQLDLMTSNARDKVSSELRQIIQSNKAMDAYGR
jgi:hypothetical protein